MASEQVCRGTTNESPGVSLASLLSPWLQHGVQPLNRPHGFEKIRRNCRHVLGVRIAAERGMYPKGGDGILPAAQCCLEMC